MSQAFKCLLYTWSFVDSGSRIICHRIFILVEGEVGQRETYINVQQVTKVLCIYFLQVELPSLEEIKKVTRVPGPTVIRAVPISGEKRDSSVGSSMDTASLATAMLQRDVGEGSCL